VVGHGVIFRMWCIVDLLWLEVVEGGGLLTRRVVLLRRNLRLTRLLLAVVCFEL